MTANTTCGEPDAAIRLEKTGNPVPCTSDDCCAQTPEAGPYAKQPTKDCTATFFHALRLRVQGPPCN
jgi:hypothetical protein